MTPLENVAAAMADEDDLDWTALPDRPDATCGHGMPEGCKSYWLRLAGVAIEAMRDPSDFMLGSIYAGFYDDAERKERAKADWQTMLTAALTETPA